MPDQPRSGLPGLGFSPSRLIGLAQLKGKIARKIGVPTTKAGRQRKVGRMIQGMIFRGQKKSFRRTNTRVEIVENVNGVMGTINGTLHERVTWATDHVKRKTQQNISIWVRWGVTSTGQRVVVERSKRGEFPRRETEKLMSSIFGEVKTGRDWVEGYVGTEVPYVIDLELKLKRQFLSRTLKEEAPLFLGRITRPIRNPSSRGRGRFGGGRKHRKFGFAFSPSHAIGLAQIKQKIGRKFIPLTKEGRQRKLGALFVPF